MASCCGSCRVCSDGVSAMWQQCATWRHCVVWAHNLLNTGPALTLEHRSCSHTLQWHHVVAAATWHAPKQRTAHSCRWPRFTGFAGHVGTAKHSWHSSVCCVCQHPCTCPVCQHPCTCPSDRQQQLVCYQRAGLSFCRWGWFESCKGSGGNKGEIFYQTNSIE